MESETNQKQQTQEQIQKNNSIQENNKMDKNQPDLTSIVLSQQKEMDIYKTKIQQLEEKISELNAQFQNLQQQFFQQQMFLQQNSPSRKGSLAIFSQYGTPQMQNQQQQHNSAVSNPNNASGPYRPHSKSISNGNIQNPQRKDSNNFLNLNKNQMNYTRKFTDDLDLLNDMDRMKARVDGQFGSININPNVQNKRSDSFNIQNPSGSSQTPQFNPIVLQKPQDGFNPSQFQIQQEEQRGNNNNINNNGNNGNSNNNINSTDDLTNNNEQIYNHKDSKVFHIPTPQFKSSMAEMQYNFPPITGGDQIISAPFSLENPFAHKLSLHKFSINLNEQDPNPFFPNVNDIQTKRRSSGSLYLPNNQQQKDQINNKGQDKNDKDDSQNLLQQQVKQEEDQNQQQKMKSNEPQFDFPTITNVQNSENNQQNQNSIQNNYQSGNNNFSSQNYNSLHQNLAFQYQQNQQQQMINFPSISQSQQYQQQKLNNNRKLSGMQGDEGNPFNLQPMKSFKRKNTLPKQNNQEQNSYNNLPNNDINLDNNNNNNNINNNQNQGNQQVPNNEKLINQNYQNNNNNNIDNNNNVANKKIPGKNVPLFIGTRLKNCLRFDCPIKRDIEKMILENGKYKYEDFLKWLDDPLMKLKEIWHFQITWTIYHKENEQEKYFKQIFKKASIMFLQNYAINSIIWSGQSLHSLTVSNSNVKKPAVLKKIGKFMQGINNSEKLRGMFNEKKDIDVAGTTSQNQFQSSQQLENNQNSKQPIKKTSLQEEMIEEINKKQKLDIMTN